MKKNFIFFISLVVVLQVNAQTPEQRMDELVSAYVNNQKFNGSVLVAQKGKVLYQKGWGFRNAEEKIPNDVNSIFQIGSVTKQFTAAIIMQLQQEHKLSVQDPLSKYFTGFVNGDKITIEHLLTHTSGIYNYTNDSVIMNNDVSKSYSQQQFIEIIRKYSPEFAPGTKWNYSNSGYQLLGYIIEKVEMKPYEQVVRQRIFQPLGMNNSGFDFEGLQVAQKTKGYFSLNKIMPAPVVDSTIAYAAGAIYSTVGDLYKWERAIFSDKILHPGSWNTVFTPQKNKYGYGWGIDTLFGKKFMAHGGGIHGYTSYLIRFPEDELVVIMIDNASSTSLSKISTSLAAIALHQPYSLPEQKKEIQLEEALLKEYVGEYQLAPNFSIIVSVEGNKLKGQATGQPAFELFAEKKDLFFLKVVEAKIEFLRNEKGEVSELILYQNGRQLRGKK